MRPFPFFLLALALFALPASARADGPWKTLFDGKDLTGWKAPADYPFWRVEKGVLIGENDEKKRGHVLYTEGAWGDFALELEVRWTGEIDSGVLFRKPELQLQFGISRSLKVDKTAAFYTGGAERYPESGGPKALEKTWKPDRWNRVKLEARGDTFRVWCNNREVTRYVDSRFPGAGPIGLQIHPGLAMKVEFRRIRIKTVEAKGD